jgi:hypothetical protein
MTGAPPLGLGRSMTLKQRRETLAQVAAPREAEIVSGAT